MRRAAAVGVLILALGSVAVGAQDAQQQPGDGGGRRGRAGGGMARMGGGQPVMGTVIAVSPASLQIKSESGATITVDVTANTRFLREREPAQQADVKVGTAILAAGMTDPATGQVHAAFISVLTPEQVTQLEARAKQMRENLGKTYIAGRVEKIEDAKLTVMRPDGVEQVIQADENTSFRRGVRGGGMGADGGMGAGGGMGLRGGQGTGAGQTDPQGQQQPQGESITLADIKAGDNVTGAGALKGGVFVPTSLNVMERRQRPQQQDDTRP